MLILLQKRIGHEPDQWEDISFPKPDMNHTPTLEFVIRKFLEVKHEGTYRAFENDDANYGGDGAVLRTAEVYRREAYEARIDGVVLK
jgi:hypothetical protein